MAHQSEAMRAMARRYLRLAWTTNDARERTKFVGYAVLYAQLSEQSERRHAAASKARGMHQTEAVDVSRRHYHSTLRATADIFAQSADAATDPNRRQMLQDFAKLYREMAALADASNAEIDDDAA